MVTLGIVVLLAGIWLTVAPLSAARFTTWARFAPYRADVASVRFYRAVGGLVSMVGVVVVAISA